MRRVRSLVLDDAPQHAHLLPAVQGPRARRAMSSEPMYAMGLAALRAMSDEELEAEYDKLLKLGKAIVSEDYYRAAPVRACHGHHGQVHGHHGGVHGHHRVTHLGHRRAHSGEPGVRRVLGGALVLASYQRRYHPRGIAPGGASLQQKGPAFAGLSGVPEEGLEPPTRGL
jgi:hypothetical protein